MYIYATLGVLLYLCDLRLPSIFYPSGLSTSLPVPHAIGPTLGCAELTACNIINTTLTSNEPIIIQSTIKYAPIIIRSHYYMIPLLFDPIIIIRSYCYTISLVWLFEHVLFHAHIVLLQSKNRLYRLVFATTD